MDTRARTAACLFVLPLLIWSAGVARAQSAPPRRVEPASVLPTPLQGIGIDQRLGEVLPLDLPFRDETGRTVRLGDYFGARPVILTLAYYECPMLCTQVLNGVVRSLRALPFTVGKEFEIVTVSFNPDEKPALASAKKAEYIASYGRPEAAAGWHFLTGDQPSISAIARAAGFRYRRDEESGQYIHASGIMVLTPDGVLARYFYGIDYAPRDLRLGLVEASAGRIGTPADRALLFCFHYDPATGKIQRADVEPRASRWCAHYRRLSRVRVRVAQARTNGAPACGPRGPRVRQHFPLFPEAASTVAGKVDALYFGLITIAGLFGTLIALLVLYFAIRYRRRSPNEVGAAIHGSIALEIVWTVIPLGIVLVIFVWSASVFFEIRRPPRGAMDVYVVGKQWMWKFQHVGGEREINELHVPVGRPVRLTMGAEDVIHAVYVPEFRVKMDVVPGRTTTLWFEATKAGRYHLFCAEYCGTQHSGMIGWVVAMDPADFQAWLSGGTAEGSLASRGERRFQDLGCSGCHRAGAQGRGPVLEGLFGSKVQLQDGQTVVADENYIRESIMNPIAKVVAGFQPRDADLPGPGRRRGPSGDHRLYQVAGGAAATDAGSLGPIRRVMSWTVLPWLSGPTISTSATV